MKSLSCAQLFATPWTVAHHAPPSLGFSRQEHWSGLPFPSPEHLPDPGIEPGSPALQADTLPSEPPVKGHVKTDLSVQAMLLQLLTSARRAQAQPQSPGDEGTGLAREPRLADPSAGIPRLGAAMRSP